MIRVKINGAERALNDADPNWINEQINRRRKDGAAVCVRITIDCPPLNMALASAGCGNSGGGGRPPNVEEKEIFHLWRKRHLDRDDFTGGNLVAFLKQLESRIRC
jgi:hypothetical protein